MNTSKKTPGFQWIKVMPLGGFWLMKNYTGKYRPVPIRYGIDVCSYCGNLVSDPRIACEWVSPDGSPFHFDSIECMVGFMFSHDRDSDGTSALVSDSTREEHLIPAEKAIYLLQAPVNKTERISLSAYACEDMAYRIQEKKGGKVLNWKGVCDLIRKLH